MTQEALTVKLGQALHGYQDGHSLLAISENLPHAAESTLFDLSDLSGPQIVPGFDEYLTGYPLPEVAIYAFAKTWYAPEMQRPGCVWTHTLLIRSSDIAQIGNFAELQRYFKRPINNPESWTQYDEQLEVSMNTSTWDELINTASFLPQLYRALYERPDSPVLVPATHVRQFESLVLQIWSQQWPRLRRAFRFCTGAIEARIIEGKSFDLQVIPYNSIGRVQHEIPNGIIIQESSSVEQPLTPEWVAQIAQDLSVNNSRFRDFLREFGADVAGKRSSFKKLVEVYNLQSSDISFMEYWENLLALFPSQSEATKLKTSVIAPNYSYSKALSIPYAERIAVLVANTHDSSYPKRLFELAESESSLAGGALRDVLQAFASAPYINSFGENLIQKIASQITPEQLSTIAATPSALMLLVTRNPRLARFQELWEITAGRHQQFLDLVAESHLTQADWEEIMHAAVRTRVPQIARSFVRIMGVYAVHAALNIFQQYSAELPSDWNAVFREQTATVAEWLHSHPDVKFPVLRVMAQHLNPFDPVLLSLGSDIWQPILDSEKEPSQRAYAFMLLIGLQNPSGKPYELASRTFCVVHEAAELEKLDSDTWMILRSFLPTLGWGRDWDICERLRQLLINKYIAYGWPIDFLFRTLRDRRTFERALLYIVSEKHLRHFGRFLLSEARSGSGSPTTAQSEILSKYEKKLRK